MTAEPWVIAEQVAQHLDGAQDAIHRWREGENLPVRMGGRKLKSKFSEVNERARAGGAHDEATDQ